MIQFFRSRENNPFTFACFFAVLFLGILLGVLFLIPDQERRGMLVDVVSPFVDLLATIALFTAAKYSAVRSRRMEFAWGTIALALLLYTLGDIVWGILEIGLKQRPYPSIADGFYLAYYPVFLVGVFLLPEKQAKPIDQINRGIDSSIVMLASILGYWNFLIGPIILSNAGQSPFLQTISLAYPVGDLVVFAGLVAIIYNKFFEEQEPLPILLLGGSILATVIADSIYSYQSLQGTYLSGGLLDFGWFVSNVLAGLAGLSQLGILKAKPISSKPPQENGFMRNLKIISPYLQYLWLMGAFVLLVYGGLTSLPMSFLQLSLGVGGIIGLVLARQIITLSENNKLNIRLQTMNQELQNEVIERARIEQQLSHDSLHDALTGLPNRTLFLDRLNQAIEYTKRGAVNKFGVLFMDLDKFKVVNDSLGHLMGDSLLVLVAQRLSRSLRSSDTVARFGGDEFEILLDITAKENSVRVVAEKIEKLFKTPFMVEGHEVYVTASVGIIENVIGYDRAEDLVQDADIAMYHAKAMGGARSEFFNTKMRDQAMYRLELENELRRGFENGELQLYYQPIMVLDSNRLIGFEALLRWNHPKRGLLLPGEFLSIAEESRLIIPIGDWILNQACLQMKTWQQKYSLLQKASISVNIASQQISQPNFVEDVVNALRTNGLQPEALKLEITEGVLISNFAKANEIFKQLRNMGVHLQIDDFGTGHSALAYLQHFPINAIKIDKSFVDEMNKDRKGMELIRAIVSMSRELGMDTIAEGIETKQQLNDLRGLACGYGQGFLLSKPLDMKAAEKILADLEKGGQLFN